MANQDRLNCAPFIAAVARGTAAGLAEAQRLAPEAELLVVFSAHGLPKKIVDAGDPYVEQVKAGVAAIADALSLPASAWTAAAARSRRT